MAPVFLLADDHGIFRNGLKMVVRDIDPSAIIYEAGSVVELKARLGKLCRVNLVLLDFALSDNQGLDLLVELQQQNSVPPFAIVSANEDAQVVQAALQLGALGYVPKSSPLSVITGAIRLMLTGAIYVPPALLYSSQQRSCTTSFLTPRQLEVLNLLAEGMSNKQIAARLNIAPGTIKTHIAAIFRELNACNRTQAVHCARELNIL